MKDAKPSGAANEAVKQAKPQEGSSSSANSALLGDVSTFEAVNLDENEESSVSRQRAGASTVSSGVKLDNVRSSYRFCYQSSRSRISAHCQRMYR